jgi:hypothetical protein
MLWKLLSIVPLHVLHRFLCAEVHVLIRSATPPIAVAATDPVHRVKRVRAVCV